MVTSTAACRCSRCCTTSQPSPPSYTDLFRVQLACPGGPVINYYIGRPESKNPAPDILPDTHSPVPVLLSRFADMGFSSRELMALIGAHTSGKQRFVSPSFANSSFDTTVDIWDVRFCEFYATLTTECV